MENGPFTDDFPNKTSIYNGFSIAMLNYQRVTCGIKICVFFNFFNGYNMVFDGYIYIHISIQ